jgi:hypothetical protein
VTPAKDGCIITDFDENFQPIGLHSQYHLGYTLNNTHKITRFSKHSILIQGKQLTVIDFHEKKILSSWEASTHRHIRYYKLGNHIIHMHQGGISVTDKHAYVLCEVQCEYPSGLVVLNNTTFAFLDKKWLRIHSINDGETHCILVKDTIHQLLYTIKDDTLFLYDYPDSPNRYRVQGGLISHYRTDNDVFDRKQSFVQTISECRRVELENTFLCLAMEDEQLHIYDLKTFQVKNRFQLQNFIITQINTKSIKNIGNTALIKLIKVGRNKVIVYLSNHTTKGACAFSLTMNGYDPELKFLGSVTFGSIFGTAHYEEKVIWKTDNKWEFEGFHDVEIILSDVQI